jgi:DNA-binding LytR/AlgR family response regulator
MQLVYYLKKILLKCLNFWFPNPIGMGIIINYRPKDDHNLEIIPFKEILYFEGKGNYAYCITVTGKYRIKEKLYELEKKMNNEFIRVGKSFIVNITNIKEIIPWFGRRLLLKFTDNKSEIEVSKNYVKSFKSHLGI